MQPTEESLVFTTPASYLVRTCPSSLCLMPITCLMSSENADLKSLLVPHIIIVIIHITGVHHHRLSSCFRGGRHHVDAEAPALAPSHH